MIAIVGAGTLGVRFLRAIQTNEPILLVDHDTVQAHNCPMQYPSSAAGLKKVDAAKQFVRSEINTLFSHIDFSSVRALEQASIIVDCTDNMLTRLLLNDFCKQQSIPLLHGALSDTVGTVIYFSPNGPCLRCIYGERPGETCTPALHTAIADMTARTMNEQLQKYHAVPRGDEFIRIDVHETRSFHMQKKPNCTTCAGRYDLLTQRRPFYITYCTKAQCMAAKPVKQKQESHGKPTEAIHDGIVVRIYPNGEIHFLTDADTDKLQALASTLYASDKHLKY